MERILNEDEKIRKAEEIYFRRNNQNISIRDKSNFEVKKSLKDKFLFYLIIKIAKALIINRILIIFKFLFFFFNFSTLYFSKFTSCCFKL